MDRVDADQNDLARRYRPPSRILENQVLFDVVGTIGLALFVSVLALWALARFFRGGTGRLVHHSERA